MKCDIRPEFNDKIRFRMSNAIVAKIRTPENDFKCHIEIFGPKSNVKIGIGMSE